MKIDSLESKLKIDSLTKSYIFVFYPLSVELGRELGDKTLLLISNRPMLVVIAKTAINHSFQSM